jgi:hypothetical protein
MDFDTNGNIIYHRENDEQDDQNFDFNTREDAYLQPSLFDEIPKKRKRIKKEQPTLVNLKEFKLSEEVL